MGRNILVVGAGAAGLLAAYSAARHGAQATVLEKNKQPGLKLLISGSGRCNLSNAAGMDRFTAAYFEHGRFLYPAFRRFFRSDLLALLKQYGVLTCTEPSGKIFPLSGRAADVRDALWSACRDAGVRFRFSEPASDLLTGLHREIRDTASRETGGKPDKPACTRIVQGVRTSQGAVYMADAVILACGGASWPNTGSNGDGYRLAASAGHPVTALRPALAGLNCTAAWLKELSGLACRDIQASLLQDGQPRGAASGDLLWTHFGVSGPVILRLSRDYQPEGAASAGHGNWQLQLDFLPGLSEETIFQMLKQSCAQKPRSLLYNALAAICFGQDSRTLPRSLIVALLKEAGGSEAAGLQSARATGSLLRQLAGALHRLPLAIHSSRGYQEAMVTAGGMSLREINPKTLMSQVVHGLYAAGEILDIDGDTGGFNLQAAFSTGYLAGAAAASGGLDSQ